jgi:hypothetical protein
MLKMNIGKLVEPPSHEGILLNPTSVVVCYSGGINNEIYAATWHFLDYCKNVNFYACSKLIQ